MTAGVSLVVLLFLLGSSIAVAAGMGLAGVILNQLYSTMPMSRIVGELTWSTTSNFILTAIPFYIMFGEILLRSGTAERMYAALVQWLSWLPGGLMHSNIGSCALFGSVSGSSVATAATIGVVAMGEIDKHKYNEPLFLGTLAAGGTLGILIPPSINMIIYGVMTDTSVPKLYLAGFLPGFILTVLFSLTVLVACIWKPHWGGTRIETNWEMRIKLLPDLLPPLVLLLIVIGAIFFGVATATEAAAVGIVGALAITAQRGRLSWRMLRDVCEGTVRTTAMVVAILVGAFFLNVIIQTIGLTQQLSKLITAWQLAPVQVLMAVIVLYLDAGDLHGGAFHDDLDHPHHDAAHGAGGLRSGLVRHPAGAADPDSDDLAAVRHQPVRHPRHPRTRHALRCREGLGAIRDRAARHDRHDLRLAGHRDGRRALVRVIHCWSAPLRGAHGLPDRRPLAGIMVMSPPEAGGPKEYEKTRHGVARSQQRKR